MPKIPKNPVDIAKLAKAIFPKTPLDIAMEQKNKEYWQGKGTRGGGVGRAREQLKDINYNYLSKEKTIKIENPESMAGGIFGYMSEKHQANLEQAAVGYYKDKGSAQAKSESEMYAKTRAMEEAVFYGEHSPETLLLTSRRARFWRQVDPKNMRKQFIMEQLGFTEAQANLLTSGKFPKGILRRQFAYKMAEFEMMGHLPRSEYLARIPSFGDTTRVISFGQYAQEPEAFFSGMFPSGKSMFIRPEQQRSFMSEVFGVTKIRRIAGTGKIVTPEQMSKVRIGAPTEDIEALKKLGTKAKIRQYIEGEIEREVPLARRERAGWVDKTKATTVNPYEYSVGKPGSKKGVPKIEDENSWFASMTRESIEGAVSEKIDITGQEGLVSKYGNEIVEGTAEAAEAAEAAGIDPWSLTGEATSGVESLYEQADIRDRSVAYLENTNWHQKKVRELKSYQNRAFVYEWVKPKGKGAKAKKERVFKGYSEEFNKYFTKGRKAFAATEISLKGKSQEEIEQILGGIKKGSTVQVQEGGKWETTVEEDATKLSQVYLQDTAEKSSKLFTSLENPIPVRAQAEQVIEVFFKKLKGRGGYGAYTAAGTFIGETSKTSAVPAKAYAKIFEFGGKYEVGWSGKKDAFSVSRYDAASQAAAEKSGEPIKEINNILDLDAQFRLKKSKDLQDKLKKIYEQTGEDYRLIAKYRFDRAQQKFVDIETNKAVDEAIAKTYFAQVEKTYARHAAAAERLKFKKIKTIDLIAGKASESAFGGKLPRGKNMVFAALSVSAALVALTAFSSRRRIMSPKDVPREAYGSNTDDERMFSGRPAVQNRANITPEYSGPMGYRTNIDVETTDGVGLDHRNFSEVMNRHASNTLRTSRGSVNMEINDNSDRATSYQLQRRYSNMLRA